MTRKTHRIRLAARRAREAGFSLIELGIVIAVIAVLATVVIMGRGFIMASRVTKAVEATNTVRKAGATYVGLQGGQVDASTANELGNLRSRGLIPAENPTGQVRWIVSGAVNNNEFSVAEVRFGPFTPPGGVAENAVGMRINTPQPAQAQDVYNSMRKDNNFIATGATVGGFGQQCNNSLPTTNSVILCFRL